MSSEGFTRRTPLVSVLMPVFNEATHLRAAIGSILSQTYSDFEFLIIDDGSTDATHDIIGEFSDARIVVTRRPRNGLVSTLNCGISQARGVHIARMDADDVSVPERLAAQAAVLAHDTDLALVGSSICVIDDNGETLSIQSMLTRDLDIRRQLYCLNPFAHGSVMMRRELLLEIGGYRDGPGAATAQDYDLWTRIVGRFKVANLPAVLYKYRINRKGVSSRHGAAQKQRAARVRRTIWSRAVLEPLRWSEVIAGAEHYRQLDRATQLELRKAFLRDQYILSLIHAYQGRAFGALVNLAAAFWTDPINAFTFVRPARLVKAYDLFRSTLASSADEDAVPTSAVE